MTSSTFCLKVLVFFFIFKIVSECEREFTERANFISDIKRNINKKKLFPFLVFVFEEINILPAEETKSSLRPSTKTHSSFVNMMRWLRSNVVRIKEIEKYFRSKEFELTILIRIFSWLNSFRIAFELICFRQSNASSPGVIDHLI